MSELNGVIGARTQGFSAAAEGSLVSTPGVAAEGFEDPDAAVRDWVLRAVQAGVVAPWVQPIFGRDLSVHGCEVLARCPFPDGRLLAPDQFAAAFGNTSDWRHLDGAMLLHAAGLVSALATSGAEPPVVAWNTAASSLTADYLEVVAAVIESFEIPPAALRLELTEQVPLLDGEPMVVLREIRRLGVQLALDDIGDSYAFLRRLREVGFEAIKLDRRLAGDVRTDVGRRLLENVIRLAHDLGAEVTAEGIDEPELHERLLDVGCDHFQGNLFGAAVTVDRFCQGLRPSGSPGG